MAANYRALVRFHFKPGMEEQGLMFLENELVKKGKEFNCHYIELWQNEKDKTWVDGIAVWNDLEDAKRFQALWEKKEKEMVAKFCQEEPKREFCKLRSIYIEKARKAA